MEKIKKKDLFPEFDQPCPFGPPHESGVYGVFETCYLTNETTLHYIGSSKNINSRVLRRRHHYWILFQDKEVYTRSIVTEDYIELEKELIRKYKPLLNKVKYDKKKLT